MPVLGRGLLSSNVSTSKRLPAPVAPTPRRRSRMIRDIAIVTHEPELLALVRELLSRRREAFFLEAWELQHLLFLLGYTDGLAPEAEIAATMEVARSDLTPDEGAA
jgi:hypothetical protein